jgi:hypothetical protein
MQNDKLTRAPLGVTTPTIRVATADSLHGKTVSLNYKVCDYFDAPSRDTRLFMNHDRPTIQIPARGLINQQDLHCLFLKFRAGHIVLGDKPIPRFEKQPNVLEEHLNMIKGAYKFEFIKEHINKIVNGSYLIGGYSKLEILESMLDAETRDPATGLGGKNRKVVMEYLDKAIQVVRNSEGGSGRVRSEKVTTPDSSASGATRPKAKISSAAAKKMLGDL